jgi:hypothetical protein
MNPARRPSTEAYEQMEIARLKAKPSNVRTKRDI